MRLAVISDIHSNIHALGKVLEDADNIGYDEILCLGDIVGYGAYPIECIKQLVLRGINSVMGNHDAGVCGKTSLEFFNIFAREAIIWTKKRLERQHINYLKSLLYTLEAGPYLFVHGALRSHFDYIQSKTSVSLNMDILKERYPNKSILFFGHTHMPFLTEGKSSFVPDSKRYKLNLESGVKYLINPGSVGQPRGGITDKACYCILDTSRSDVTFRRVSYDVDAAAKSIVENGLPEFLSQRLYGGH